MTKGLRVWDMGRPLWVPATKEQLEATKQKLLERGYAQKTVAAYDQAVREVWESPPPTDGVQP